ncbi:MAG TPA: heme-binding protein [Terriglobia bacterium]|nr:heme-binding protein [Terriglobia bacterium]
MSRLLIWTAAALAMIAASADAQVLMQRNISVAQAMAVANGAIESCGRANGQVTITVAVVDRAGDVRLIINGDTASPHNLELARRKAYTARTFRRPSLEWAKGTAGDSQLAGQRQLADVIPLGGGVPIMIGDEAIGAVGVSGSAGGQPGDEACARAGVAAIAAQLK